VFLHRLALAMHRPVDELTRSMSMRELLDWQRFEVNHQPLPDRLSDIHIAMVCSIIVNLARSPESMPVQLADFLILRDRQPEPNADRVSEVDRQMANWRGG
jgi:hypothetical protein